jgi:16S rRNA (cytidine1402-2'-O)-methyltransferase
VGTPIGNLGDLTFRARAALTAAEILACEDTRRARRLLAALGIAGPKLVSLYKDVESARVPGLIDQIVMGKSVTYITDAGMPGVSDPGALLVSQARAAGLEIEVIPGVSAVATALALSGFDGRRFVFEGFLPRSGPARQRALLAIEQEERPVVVFESPHRMASTLAELAGVLDPDREVFVARELTKLHEETWYGTILEAARYWQAVRAKGEITFVIGPGRPAAARSAQELVGEADLAGLVAAEVGLGGSRRDVAGRVARRGHIPHRIAYQAVLDCWPDQAAPPEV